MPFTLSPDAKFIGFDDEGDIVPGGKLFTYAAGTSTPLATYLDAAGTVNTNPVILDSAGRATIYLTDLSYKFVFKDANDVQLWSQDNISDAALTSVQGDLVGTTDVQTLSNKTLNVPTINFGTLNSVTINQPAINNPTVATGTFNGPSITNPIFSTRVAFIKRVEWAKGANLVSSSVLTLGDDGNVFALTGSSSIDVITTSNWQPGSVIILILTGGMQLTNNSGGPANTAKMLLSGGIHFNSTDPATITLVFDGVAWQEVCRSVNHA